MEEIVDLILPTPLPKKKKLIIKFFKQTKKLPRSHWSMYAWYPRTGASTTNKNSVILFPIIQSRTLISCRNFLMFRHASGCDPFIPNCRLGSAFYSAETLGNIRYIYSLVLCQITRQQPRWIKKAYKEAHTDANLISWIQLRSYKSSISIHVDSYHAIAKK